MRSLIATALIAALAGCARNGDRGETPAPTPAPSDTGETMREHFDAVDAVKAALIEGDLAGAQTEVARIVDRPASADLAHWKDHVDRLREAGRQVQAAADVEAASMAAARLGAACGSCHAALGHRPELKQAPEPAADETIAARMQRHQWAADRLWEGLVAPSDELWRAGAAAIADAELIPEGSEVAALHELATRARALGKRAIAARDQGERAEIFGALLSSCGDCHRLARPR